MNMHKYDYRFKPPAPALNVKIQNPAKPHLKRKKNALLDSGAYKTVIPDDLIRKLKLLRAGEEHPKGYKGPRQKHWTYIVTLEFNGFLYDYIEVIAVKRKNVLLGRDILNRTKLLLDGKNRKFDISDP